MIAVCGPNEATGSELRLAETVGAAIARAGHALVCGGRGGVIEAACRGARRAGGTTIGILPGYDRAEANPWVEHAVCTGLGHARNAVVVASGDAVIAVGGGFGTLSEIGLALKLGKRVVSVGSWDLDGERVARFATGAARYLYVDSAEEAVTLALADHAELQRLESPPSSHG